METKLTGLRIKKLRLEQGIKQAELGLILGVGATAISNYESGRNCIDNDKLKLLAEYFRVSLDYLLGVSDNITMEIANLDEDAYSILIIYNALNTDYKRLLKICAKGLLHEQEVEVQAHTEI